MLSSKDYRPLVVSLGPLRLDGVGTLACAREVGSGRRVYLRTVPEMPQAQEALEKTRGFPKAPGLPEVLDGGLWEGAAWFTSEFPEGQLLSDGDRFGDALVARHGARLAQALAALHEASVVHGGISPEAVLMTAQAEAVLHDAALLLVNRATDRRPEETQSALYVRIARYVAPEVLAGGEATPASDVYALGTLLLLQAGAEPPKGKGQLDVLRACLTGSWRPQAPAAMHPALKATLLLMISDRPGERLQAAEVAARLSDPSLLSGLTSPNIVMREAPTGERPPEPRSTAPGAPGWGEGFAMFSAPAPVPEYQPPAPVAAPTAAEPAFSSPVPERSPQPKADAATDPRQSAPWLDETGEMPDPAPEPSAPPPPSARGLPSSEAPHLAAAPLAPTVVEMPSVAAEPAPIVPLGMTDPYGGRVARAQTEEPKAAVEPAPAPAAKAPELEPQLEPPLVPWLVNDLEGEPKAEPPAPVAERAPVSTEPAPSEPSVVIAEPALAAAVVETPAPEPVAEPVAIPLPAPVAAAAIEPEPVKPPEPAPAPAPVAAAPEPSPTVLETPAVDLAALERSRAETVELAAVSRTETPSPEREEDEAPTVSTLVPEAELAALQDKVELKTDPHGVLAYQDPPPPVLTAPARPSVLAEPAPPPSEPSVVVAPPSAPSSVVVDQASVLTVERPALPGGELTVPKVPEPVRAVASPVTTELESIATPAPAPSPKPAPVVVAAPVETPVTTPKAELVTTSKQWNTFTEVPKAPAAPAPHAKDADLAFLDDPTAFELRHPVLSKFRSLKAKVALVVVAALVAGGVVVAVSGVPSGSAAAPPVEPPPSQPLAAAAPVAAPEPVMPAPVPPPPAIEPVVPVAPPPTAALPSAAAIAESAVGELAPLAKPPPPPAKPAKTKKGKRAKARVEAAAERSERPAAEPKAEPKPADPDLKRPSF